MIDETDMRHLRRCVDLAAEALAAGERPFASVLVAADGTVLAEDHNRANSTGDPTRHPEFALARWAAENMTPEQRKAATVYTSGEHCPMCSAAHAWVGLGPIVCAATSAQLVQWRTEWGLPPAPVTALPVTDVAPGVRVTGPVAPYDERIRALHDRARTGA